MGGNYRRWGSPEDLLLDCDLNDKENPAAGGVEEEPSRPRRPLVQRPWGRMSLACFRKAGLVAAVPGARVWVEQKTGVGRWAGARPGGFLNPDEGSAFCCRCTGQPCTAGAVERDSDAHSGEHPGCCGEGVWALVWKPQPRARVIQNPSDTGWFRPRCGHRDGLKWVARDTLWTDRTLEEWSLREGEPGREQWF